MEDQSLDIISTIMKNKLTIAIRKIMDNAVHSQEKFPIILDDVWTILGYSQRRTAMKSFMKSAIQGKSQIQPQLIVHYR